MISILFNKQSFLTISLIAFSALRLANAADITVEVRDSKGNVLKDAVVFFESNKSLNKSDVKIVDIEQKGKQFNPLVSVVQTGASINFPNRDKVRHHVYSFSPAKKFELKLYSGVPANPVQFDKPGTVVLGCNIHDNMLAYVHIVDTPYFAKTDGSGIANVTNVPEDTYELKVWHYALQNENKPVQQTVTIKANNPLVVIPLEINDMKRI